ncbi:MAG: hypothetical protein P8Y00_05170 [Deltaproteobacteria bacterium]
MLKDKKYVSIRLDESHLKKRNKALSTLQEMSSLLDSSTDISIPQRTSPNSSEGHSNWFSKILILRQGGSTS